MCQIEKRDKKQGIVNSLEARFDLIRKRKFSKKESDSKSPV